jgi:imidazolonepropionase-like amidohydrolase
MDSLRAGISITAGTDEPEGMLFHAELFSYVEFGMTPYEALRTATVNPAELLDLDAGSIQPGKLADIVLVKGNPLDDIENTDNVRQVIMNGRVFREEDLVSGKAKDAPRR